MLTEALALSRRSWYQLLAVGHGERFISERLEGLS
jgi:hypothetical protein